MQRTISEITHDLMTDPRPSVDGCSNVDRIAFILEVFEVETLDINTKFDFSNIPQCKDPDMVLACKHLALLQLEYAGRLHQSNHIGVDDLNLHTSTLILAIQRINWHLHHLEIGRATPPFPFIH